MEILNCRTYQRQCRLVLPEPAKAVHLKPWASQEIKAAASRSSSRSARHRSTAPKETHTIRPRPVFSPGLLPTSVLTEGGRRNAVTPPPKKARVRPAQSRSRAGDARTLLGPAARHVEGFASATRPTAPGTTELQRRHPRSAISAIGPPVRRRGRELRLTPVDPQVQRRQLAATPTCDDLATGPSAGSHPARVPR